MSRYIVELEEAFTVDFLDPSFKPIRIARVYEKEDGWPTKRQKPLLTLSADSEEGAAEQVVLWIRAGKRSAADLKTELVPS